jgi:ribosomal protein L20A (L18A)
MFDKDYVVYWISTDETSKRYGETSIIQAINFSDAYEKAYQKFGEVTQVVLSETHGGN